MKENQEFINKAAELEYYKSKYESFFQELNECHLKIKSLEDSNYLLKEKVANFKNNNINNTIENNTANNFLTPIEFKKLWEFIIKTDFMDAFDFCINEYILIANLCQDLMLLIYDECKNIIEKKFIEVLTCLNLGEINPNKRKEIYNSFLPFFRENFSKIFIFSENFTQIIIPKLLIIIFEYNYDKDIISNKEINYNQITEKIRQNIFESLIKNFFKICIYMILHDPTLTFNLTKYKQRTLKYFFFNKNDFINVDGFVNDQENNTPCIVLLPPPLIKNKYIFNGIKSPVYIISNPDKTIISECKKNSKISNGNNADIILLENNNIKTTKMKVETSNNKNNNALKNKMRTPIKPISFKDMKILFSFYKNKNSNPNSQRYQINNTNSINNIPIKNIKSNNNENKFKKFNLEIKNIKKYLKKTLTSDKDYNIIPKNSGRKMVCNNTQRTYKISETHNHDISESQGVSYIIQNYTNNLNKCPNFINTSSGHSTAINNSISNINYYEKRIINIKFDSNIISNNTTNTMKNTSRQKNKKCFSFIENVNEKKRINNNICIDKKILTPSNRKLKNIKIKGQNYSINNNKIIELAITPKHISINSLYNKNSENKCKTKLRNKKITNYIIKTKIPSKIAIKNNSIKTSNKKYKMKNTIKNDNKSSNTEKINTNVLNQKKAIKINKIIDNINKKSIYTSKKIQNDLKELIPNLNNRIIVNCKKINNIINKSLSLTYRSINGKNKNLNNINNNIIDKSSSSSNKNKLSSIHSNSNIEKKLLSKTKTLLSKKRNKINYYKFNTNASKNDIFNKALSNNIKLFNSFYDKKKIKKVTTINKFKNPKYNIKINTLAVNSDESRNDFGNSEKTKSNKNSKSKNNSNNAIFNLESLCISSSPKIAYIDSCLRTQENYDTNYLFMKELHKVSEEKNKIYKTEGNQKKENINKDKKNININFMLLNELILKNK